MGSSVLDGIAVVLGYGGRLLSSGTGVHDLRSLGVWTIFPLGLSQHSLTWACLKQFPWERSALHPVLCEKNQVAKCNTDRNTHTHTHARVMIEEKKLIKELRIN